MKIDSIYGSFDITEPVLIELLNSKELNRLKDISQGGYLPAYKDQEDASVSNRYNHSIGVFCLLRRFKAPLEEQIAGLLHDVSHTAFSHAIDYAFKSISNQQNQSFQDDHHETFIKHSDIPVILNKYNINVDYILDDSHFPLKENELPDLCADRLDYSLMCMYTVYKMITESEKDYIVDSLTVYNSSFIMKDFESAKFYAEKFLELDNTYFSGLRSAVMLAFNGKLFQTLIRDYNFKVEDFLNYTNSDVIKIIENHIKDNPELKKYYDYLHLTTDNFKNDKNDYEEHVFCKSRAINPQFLKDGKLYRVSDFDNDFKKQLESVGKYKEYFIRCIK